MAITINGTGSITGLTAGGLPDGSVTAADIASGVIPDAVSLAVLTDVKTQGTQGGTFTSGAWRTRDLNTEQSDPDGIVTLSSNQFTLTAGTYLIQWECPAYRVTRHQSRLWDVTATAVVEMGMSRYDEGSSEQNNGFSPGSAVVTITSDHVYEIQHRCVTTFNNNGFGVDANLSSERYTRVIIWKVA